ncbi:hypothetical protein Z945_2800 [Sulfitobacter noctilucae]|nr:hypothetical protein Z945_2800 [Sulfitobacter noctilucae]
MGLAPQLDIPRTCLFRACWTTIVTSVLILTLAAPRNPAILQYSSQRT